MLMKRLEQALDAGLTPKIASEKTFAAGTEGLSHESQIVAALADVIAREGYEYADDEAFRKLATAMQSQAVAASKAIAQKDYESARQAIGEISKACANCHESFRN
jgi:cytochrome c556